MIINSLKQSGSYCKMHVFVTVKESAININWSILWECPLRSTEILNVPVVPNTNLLLLYGRFSTISGDR